MKRSKPNQHGGARKGAGRKDAGVKRVNIVISPADDEIAVKLGGGNRSRGISIALKKSTT